MDEAIRIYNPTKRLSSVKISRDSFASVRVDVAEVKKSKLKSESPAVHSKWKYFFDKAVWKDVLENKQHEIRELQQKYTWFPIMYNWLIVFLVVGLFVSFIVWGVNINTEHKAEAYAAAVAAEKDAEHRAFIAQQEADRRAAEQSVENLMKKNATAKAKLAYGSRNFIDKFNYSDSDFMTLYQCVDNRLNNKMYTGMTIDEIVFQDGQFIASYDSNPVQDYYFNLAMKSERLKNDAVSEPIGTDYVYAIYTPHGIYLTNDPKAPQYTWWHYSE